MDENEISANVCHGVHKICDVKMNDCIIIKCWQQQMLLLLLFSSIILRSLHVLLFLSLFLLPGINIQILCEMMAAMGYNFTQILPIYLHLSRCCIQFDKSICGWRCVILRILSFTANKSGNNCVETCHRHCRGQRVCIL